MYVLHLRHTDLHSRVCAWNRLPSQSADGCYHQLCAAQSSDVSSFFTHVTPVCHNYIVLYCKLIILAVTIETKTHSHANSSSGNVEFFCVVYCTSKVIMCASLIAKYSLESSVKDCGKKCSPSYSPEQPIHFSSWHHSSLQSRYWQSRSPEIKKKQKAIQLSKQVVIFMKKVLCISDVIL